AFPYKMSQKDIRGSLNYAIQEGIFFEIAPNVYMTPITESFRKHMIFVTDRDGRVRHAFQVLIRGDKKRKYNIEKKERIATTQDLEENFPNETFSPKIIFERDFPEGTYEFYNENMQSKTSGEIQVIVLDYPIDGKRVTNITHEMIRTFAEQNGLQVKDVSRKIIEQIAPSFSAIQLLNYTGLTYSQLEGFMATDQHPENYLISGLDMTPEEIKNLESPLDAIFGMSVGDFGAFEKVNKNIFKKYLQRYDASYVISGAKYIRSLFLFGVAGAVLPELIVSHSIANIDLFQTAFMSIMYAYFNLREFRKGLKHLFPEVTEKEIYQIFKSTQGNMAPLVENKDVSMISQGRRQLNYLAASAAGMEINLQDLNQNQYGVTSAGAVSAGNFMMRRQLMPEKEDFPFIYLIPEGRWQGEDGSNIMQLYFNIFANYAIHKRKAQIFVKNREAMERVKKYLALGNPYVFENLGPYETGLYSRLIIESHYMADRQEQDMSQIRPEDHMIDFHILDEGDTAFESIKVTQEPDGTTFKIQDTKTNEKLILSANGLKDFQVTFDYLNPLTEVPDYGVTILGSSSGMDPNGLTSGHIAWLNKRGMLVDAGAHVVDALKALNVQADQLDYFFITHLHEDHVAGALKLFQWLKDNDHQITLLMEPGVHQKFVALMDLILGQEGDFQNEYGNTFIYEAVPYYQKKELRADKENVQLETIPGFHGTWTSMIKLTNPNGEVMVFSGDTNSSAALFNVLTKENGEGLIQQKIQEIQNEIKRHLPQMKLLPILTEKRSEEIISFLFGSNASLIIHEMGAYTYKKYSGVVNKANHTTVWDLAQLKRDVQRNVLTTHAPGIPDEFNELYDFNHVQAMTTYRIANGTYQIVNPDQKMGSSAPSTVQSRAEYGGVDFNPDQLIINEQGDALRLDLPTEVNFDIENFNGFTPYIIQITPISNLPLLLGAHQEVHHEQDSTI
ncbi:MAG: MBL fold metallo-hydrolase, partial [Candidatus Omnitrophica bacterium]|nr:MBL fold metallo-hydrolase [Candidatus Omnitrophota bacterium]